MAEQFSGLVEIQDSGQTETRIALDGDTATIGIGGGDQEGVLSLRTSGGVEKARIEGNSGEMKVIGLQGEPTLRMQGLNGDLILGSNGASGNLALYHGDTDDEGDYGYNEAEIHLNAAQKVINLRENGQNRIILRGTSADIGIGGNGRDGDLYMHRSGGSTGVAAEASIHLDGDQANAWLGGQGVDGDLILFPAQTNYRNIHEATIHLDGSGGNIMLGSNGADGDLVLYRSDVVDLTDSTKASIHLDGQQGNLWLGSNGVDGDLLLFPSSATEINDADQATIHLNGENGDIVLSGADCAENFRVVGTSQVEAGTVLVIDEKGSLRESDQAYDKKVAGVVSGAGENKPGIILNKINAEKDGTPVALNGVVYCKADASNGPIEVGDLLTTSSNPGHAMRADDPVQAFGAVLGKALEPLSDGLGLIPILVALQ